MYVSIYICISQIYTKLKHIPKKKAIQQVTHIDLFFTPLPVSLSSLLSGLEDKTFSDLQREDALVLGKVPWSLRHGPTSERFNVPPLPFHCQSWLVHRDPYNGPIISGQITS